MTTRRLTAALNQGTASDVAVAPDDPAAGAGVDMPSDVALEESVAISSIAGSGAELSEVAQAALSVAMSSAMDSNTAVGSCTAPETSAAEGPVLAAVSCAVEISGAPEASLLHGQAPDAGESHGMQEGAGLAESHGIGGNRDEGGTHLADQGHVGESPVAGESPIPGPEEATPGNGTSGGGSAQRPRGRPPNISENSLLRRLECLLAVERGQITMKEACDTYAISARTFYRWLADKERLITLTGYNVAAGGPVDPASTSPATGGPIASPMGIDATTPEARPQGRKRSADAAFASPRDLSEKRRLPATRPRSKIRTPGSQPMRPHIPTSSPIEPKLSVMPVQLLSDGSGTQNGETPITPQKTRVVLQFRESTAVLGWHFGAAADEIRETIARRFAIEEGTDWAFVDSDGDELVVSHVIPSGSYKIVVMDKQTEPNLGDACQNAEQTTAIGEADNVPTREELPDKLVNVEEVVNMDATMAVKHEPESTSDAVVDTSTAAEL